MLNEALNLDYEIIGGEKFMAAAANPMHALILFKISKLIDNYMDDHDGGFVFTDTIDVHFQNGDIFMPDVTVITSKNTDIIIWDGAIYGVPDMVVEVLSPSTRKKDLTIKKDIYEENGVNEYWIVDPLARTVDVYILRDGKFYFDESYHKYSEDELKKLTDKEKSEIKTEIKISIFDDLYIKIDNIFLL